MTYLPKNGFLAESKPSATSRGAVAALVKAWESKNAQRVLRSSGLGLMAVSLAACGGSDEAPAPPPAPTPDPVTSIALTSAQDVFGVNAPVNDNYLGANGTLTSGDVVVTSGTVKLNLSTTTGALDGQTITASAVNIDASGGVAIAASDWTISTVKIMDSTGNVSVLDLQNTATRLIVDDLVDSAATATFNFDAQALTGASIVNVSLAEVTSAVALTGGNIETVNITIIDKSTDAESTLVDFTATGNTTLNIAGGTAGFDFNIVGDLDPGLTMLNGSTAASDLNLSIASSTTAIKASTGLGNDVLATGDTIGDLDEQDTFDGNAGSDELTAVFTTVGTRSPISSEFETFTLTFNNSATLDFADVNDVTTVNVLESSHRAELIDMDNTVKTLNVYGEQEGDWEVEYASGQVGTLTVNWENNSGAGDDVGDAHFSGLESLTFVARGDDDVDFDDLSVDDDVTETLVIRNEDSGDVSIDSDIDGTDALKFLTVETKAGGDIQFGGIDDAGSLRTFVVSASASGYIGIGDIGDGGDGSADRLEYVKISSAGADVDMDAIYAYDATISKFIIEAGDDSGVEVAVGCDDIYAQDIGEMTISIASDASVTLGTIHLEEQGDSLIVSGSGDLNSLTFDDEAFALMDFSGLVNDSVSVVMYSSEGDVEIIGTEDYDFFDVSGSEGSVTINAGKGADVVIFGDGVDTYVLNSGDTVLWTAGPAATAGDNEFYFGDYADVIVNFADEAAGEYASSDHNDLIVFNGVELSAADFANFGTLTVGAGDETIYTASTVAGFEDFYVAVGDWDGSSFYEGEAEVSGDPDFMFVHYNGLSVQDVLIIANDYIS